MPIAQAHEFMFLARVLHRRISRLSRVQKTLGFLVQISRKPHLKIPLNLTSAPTPLPRTHHHRFLQAEIYRLELFDPQTLVGDGWTGAQSIARWLCVCDDVFYRHFTFIRRCLMKLCIVLNDTQRTCSLYVFAVRVRCTCCFK